MNLGRVWKILEKTYFILFCIYIVAFSFSKVSDNPRSVIWSDSEGYYKYLPGLFIIQDVHKIPEGSIWPTYTENGEYIIKYTCGIAILQLPFFLLCWLFQYIMGYNYHDIFNDYFAYGVQISGLFYGIWGLYLLKNFLKNLHPIVPFLVIVTVLFGTNFYYYLCCEAGMSHIYSFFLFIALLTLTRKYYQTFLIKDVILLGFLIGLITLIRPTNSIVFLLFILWDVKNIEGLKQRILLLFAQWQHFILMGLASFLIFIPQLLYWHEMTGHWVFYSYTEEGFDYIFQPKFINILFDTRNGLITYTPIVLLLFWALVRTIRYPDFPSKTISFLILAFTYIFASWWSWWFGGALGYRSYIELYALLSIPLAYFLDQQWKNHKWKFFIILPFIILCCHYNIALTDFYISSGKNWSNEDWIWNLEKIKWVWKAIFT